jgi:hypothetical protein
LLSKGPPRGSDTADGKFNVGPGSGADVMEDTASETEAEGSPGPAVGAAGGGTKVLKFVTMTSLTPEGPVIFWSRSAHLKAH